MGHGTTTYALPDWQYYVGYGGGSSMGGESIKG